jgi:uncharacterized protein involved in exopolysaccharide biosynthesis
MDGAQGPTVDLRWMVVAVLRRWELVTIIPELVLAHTYGVMKAVPVYTSTVEILIFDPQRQIDEAIQKQISPLADAVDNTIAINNEIEVIKSRSLALRVAKELGLDNDNEFQRRGGLLGWAESFSFSIVPLRGLLEKFGMRYPPPRSRASRKIQAMLRNRGLTKLPQC